MKIPSREVIGIFFFVIFNICLFIYANNVPIYWQQGEVTQHRVFWSINSEDDWTFHLGLTKEDLLKPFHSYRVEGLCQSGVAFRTRFVSYFTEMLTYKFWQYLGCMLFRDYSLIFWHVLNTFLLGLLIFHLTKSREAALCSSFAFLNSGIALATLLFPFRNAKILVMTFFLLAWIILMRGPKKFCEENPLRLTLFFVVIGLGLLTDEIFFYLLPIFPIYIGIRDGYKTLFHPRVVGTMIIFLVGMGFLFMWLVKMAQRYDQIQLGFVAQKEFFNDLLSYFSQPVRMLRDIGKAFTGYFLRRNFGFWDLSFWGQAAYLSFFVILAGLARLSSSRVLKTLAVTLIGVLIVKSLLLAHSSGVHPIFMPEDTFFPSLFFFSYYYPYCEDLLIWLLLGILLSGSRFYRLRWVGVFFLITIIGVSNVFHLQKGPKDGLVFHGWHQPQLQGMMKSILTAKKESHQKKNQPIYLSFPSGEGRLYFSKNDPGQQRFDYLFSSIIPVNFLRLIRDGTVIISLENIKDNQNKTVISFSEILMANCFFDVPTGTKIDLRRLKKTQKSLTPKVVLTQQQKVFTETLAEKGARVVFFVKGMSQVSCQMNEKTFQGEQFYGDSYQLFSVPIPQDISGELTMKIGLKSMGRSNVYLVGPYVSDE